MTPAIPLRVPPRAENIFRRHAPPVVRRQIAYGFCGAIAPRDRQEIERVLSCDNGLAVLGIWVTLGQLAHGCLVPGLLVNDDWEPLGLARLAAAAHTSGPVMAAGIETLESLGVIEERTIENHLLAVAAFIRAECATGEGRFVGCRKLWEKFEAWGDTNNHPIERSQFRKAIAALGFQLGRSRRVKGRQIRSFEGLSIGEVEVTPQNDVTLVELISVEAFIDAECVRGEDQFIGCRRLWEKFEAWTVMRKHEHPMPRRSFRKALLALGFSEGRSHRVNGFQLRCFEGVCVREGVVSSPLDVTTSTNDVNL